MEQPLLHDSEAVTIGDILTPELRKSLAAYPEQIKTQLNNPEFRSKVTSFVGEKFGQFIKDRAFEKPPIKLPGTTGSTNAPNSTKSNSVEAPFTKGFFKNSIPEVRTLITQIEGQGDKGKKLSDLLKVAVDTPSVENIKSIQNALIQDWSKNISNKGRADGDFGPLTLSAIRTIAAPDKPTSVAAPISGTPDTTPPEVSQVGTAPTASIPPRSTDVSPTTTAPSVPSVDSTSTPPVEGRVDKTPDFNLLGESVRKNGNDLKNRVDEIKKGAHPLNAGSKIDEATGVFGTYLEVNRDNLKLLANNRSSLEPNLKKGIIQQLTELEEILKKGARFPMTSPQAQQKMTDWIPEITGLREKLTA